MSQVNQKNNRNSILLLSNSQTLRNNLADFGLMDQEFLNQNPNKIQDLKIIIFENEEQKDYLQKILEQTKSSLILIEISNKIQQFQNHKNYIFFKKPLKLNFLFDQIYKILEEQENLINLGKFLLDINKRILILDDPKLENIHLTELETKIIFYLYKNNNSANKNDLLSKIWGYKNHNQMTETGLVETAIFKLNKKLTAINFAPMIEIIDGCLIITD